MFGFGSEKTEEELPELPEEEETKYPYKTTVYYDADNYQEFNTTHPPTLKDGLLTVYDNGGGVVGVFNWSNVFGYEVEKEDD